MLLLKNIELYQKMFYFPNIVFLEIYSLTSNVILLRFFKKMAYFNVKYYFIYIIKTHKINDQTGI